MERDLFVGIVAFVAAAINAAAGGGSFLTFPAVLAIGVPPIAANATNNVAMWLGALTSAGEFRSDLALSRTALGRILAASVAGSVIGAIVLVRTSNAAFVALIPALLFVATAIYVAGPAIARRTQSLTVGRPDGALALALQFLIAIYGGFFGAAMGILMMALFGLMGLHEFRQANALKSLLAATINGVAVVPFVLAHVIDWEVAIVMSVGAIAGGYAGAVIVRRIPPLVARRIVIAIAVSMTAYFTWSTYLVPLRTL